MPKMGDAMVEGKLLQWTKTDGTTVRPGDVIAEIETDKSNVEIEAEDEGVLRILVSPGETIPVGNIIARIGDGDIADTASIGRAQPKAGNPPGERAPAVFQTASPTAEKNGQSIKASPLARRIAREQGIEISRIKGSGPFGRVIEADIAAYIADRERSSVQEINPAPAQRKRQIPSVQPAVTKMPAVAQNTTPAQSPMQGAIELSAIRKVIARRMVESKTTIPHFYITVEIDMTEAMELRERLNSMNGEYRISINDMVVKAVAKALVDVPAVNAAFKDDTIIPGDGVNVGIAVALDDGLIVPVVRDADKLTLRGLSQAGKVLIKKARDKKLLPDDYSGGTFTVSNLGAFEVDNFIAIIDPSQGAILAVSSIVRKPVILDGGDAIIARHRMNATLSGDHRVMDGASGAKFTQALKRYLENPISLLE